MGLMEKLKSLLGGKPTPPPFDPADFTRLPPEQSVPRFVAHELTIASGRLYDPARMSLNRPLAVGGNPQGGVRTPKPDMLDIVELTLSLEDHGVVTRDAFPDSDEAMARLSLSDLVRAVKKHRAEQGQ